MNFLQLLLIKSRHLFHHIRQRIAAHGFPVGGTHALPQGRIIQQLANVLGKTIHIHGHPNTIDPQIAIRIGRVKTKAFHNINLLQEEMGHRDSNLLRTRYLNMRNLTTNAATAFFKMR